MVLKASDVSFILPCLKTRALYQMRRHLTSLSPAVQLSILEHQTTRRSGGYTGVTNSHFLLFQPQNLTSRYALLLFPAFRTLSLTSCFYTNPLFQFLRLLFRLLTPTSCIPNSSFLHRKLKLPVPITQTSCISNSNFLIP